MSVIVAGIVFSVQAGVSTTGVGVKTGVASGEQDGTASRRAIVRTSALSFGMFIYIFQCSFAKEVYSYCSAVGTIKTTWC